MSDQPKELAELEKPILDLDAQVKALELDASKAKERDRLAKKVEKMRTELSEQFTDWQRAQLARHPRRPYALDHLERICDSFEEIHGDRQFADDPAIVGGMAWMDGRPVMIIAQQKGRDTKQKVLRNFGMPRPEGYRKALRLMKMAEKFGRPIVTLIDTPGAFPGVDAEERGQAEAIARNLKEMAKLTVPVVAAVIGEGGSGGALALGVADRVLMMECAIYSVISPEGCASILWKDASQAPAAAAALRLTASHLRELEVVDQVVKEPAGGAHWDWDEAAAFLKAGILSALAELDGLTGEALVEARYQKFSRMGAWAE